jgi:glycosyltransferase involved in cell wall biosynthesis
VPLDEPTRRKFDAMAPLLDVRVVAASVPRTASPDPRFFLVAPIRPGFLDGIVFYLALPFRVAHHLRGFAPDVVVVQGVHELTGVLFSRVLARRRPRVILDVHGDWRAATRLYGSRLRQLLNPLSDRMAAVAVTRADAIRTISGFTTSLVRELGREPAATFPAYVDADSFTRRRRAPLPERPQALFVGVLERNKNIDGLAAAWRIVAPRVPEARLRIVGSGRLTHIAERLVADFPGQVTWEPALSSQEIAQALDESTFLVLPSRSEGMGRVAIEAFCRGRPVLGAGVGGIRDLVEDGVSGLLVDPDDVDGLAQALVRMLTDRTLMIELAAGARRSARHWLQTPEVFAQRMGALVTGTSVETS